MQSFLRREHTEKAIGRSSYAKELPPKPSDSCVESTTLSIERYDTQGPFDATRDAMKRIRRLVAYAKLKESDELIGHLESIVALIFNIRGCRDYGAVAGAIYLFASKFMKQSMTTVVMDYVYEIFEFLPQSNDDSPVDGDIVQSNSWSEMMFHLRDNWDIVKNNKLFTYFSKLLGLLVTMELCKASNVTFTIKNFKVWGPDLQVIHGNALDVFDAAFSTIVFFVETISLCWENNSLMPLFLDKDQLDIDTEYSKVIMWWELVKNGNLKKVADVSEHEFDSRLEALTTRIKYTMTGFKGFEKKLLQDKFSKLLQIKSNFVTKKVSSGVRKAPFCIELFGESSQGKTTFGEQIVHALLVSANLPTGKEFQAAHNAGDRFWSTWTSDKTVLLVDDMANDKSDYVERPPTRVIIDVANNAPFVANMADIDSKGKVFVEPEIMLVTTNVKDLDARAYSNCPYSIQRRMHVVATVVCRPEFQRFENGKPQGLDSRKVAEFNKTQPNMEFDDIWTITLERAEKPPTLKDAANYVPIVWNGEKLENISFRKAVQYMIEEFTLHRSMQDNILDRMSHRRNICVCGVDGCNQIKGWCDKHPDAYDKQYGEEIANSIERSGSLIGERIKKDLFGLGSFVEGSCTVALMGAAKYFSKHWDWMTVVPTPWLNNSLFSNFMMFMHKGDLRRSYIRKTCMFWTAVVGSLVYNRKTLQKLPFGVTLGVCSGIGAFSVSFQKSMVNTVKREFHNQLVDRNTIGPMAKEYRDRHMTSLFKACGIVGALYTVANVYKAFYHLSPQGSLQPTTKDEVRQRDAEGCAWSPVVMRPLPVQPEAVNTTYNQLVEMVEWNMVYGSVETATKNLKVNGFFIDSNFVLLPDHYFVDNPTFTVTFRKVHPRASAGSFVTLLSKTQSVLIPNTDLRLCYSSAGGSFRNLCKYFPDGHLPQLEFTMKWRNFDGTLETADGLATQKMTGNGHADFEGLVYDGLTTNTFEGMCGAILISKMKPMIVGMHLGGRAGTPRGCAGILQNSQILIAAESLRKIEAVVKSGSSEKFETQVLGVEVITKDKLHPKSPLNYMPEKSQIAYYGSCPGMSTFKSDFTVLPSSEHVTDVCGEPNVYRPPVEDPQWFGWQKCLEKMANPARPFDPDLLILAVRDYKEDLMPLFKGSIMGDIKPLDDHENLCGIPGLRFIDAIKLNTSIGFPLSGAKRKFVVELPPTEDKPNNKIFSDEILQEIERCMEFYRKGERAHVIMRACKKDEVLSKEKCRIFFACCIALVFLVRRYFLPLIRVLQFFPKISECAVGVNSHGPEWQELHDHIFTFGEDRLIGGDYGNYDQKLPSQLLFAALRILIDFAREAGYSEEDLSIMEAMTGDLVFALIAFNGDLIGLTEGSHISGNSLTVILNGICGSLNLRCYFYSQNPSFSFEERKRFRDCVKLMTYGDDNIGSVSPHVHNFTIKGASEFLDKYGQKYTMPDKESELTDFLPPEEFEFLKRKSVWHPELGVHLGALVDKSCFKMLHCCLRGKKAPLSIEHMTALNIDTALREWFNHGPDVYEKRRLEMIEIAERSGVKHLCSELEVSYQARACMWDMKYKYGVKVQELETPLEIFADL